MGLVSFANPLKPIGTHKKQLLAEVASSDGCPPRRGVPSQAKGRP